VLTEQIFPSPEADGLALYAKGGTARLISLDVWVLQSIWKRTVAWKKRVRVSCRAPDWTGGESESCVQEYLLSLAWRIACRLCLYWP